MKKEQLEIELKALNIDLNEACTMIYNHTGAVISARDVRKTFDRTGYLSAPMTGLFSYFLKTAKKEKNG